MLFKASTSLKSRKVGAEETLRRQKDHIKLSGVPGQIMAVRGGHKGWNLRRACVKRASLVMMNGAW